MESVLLVCFTYEISGAQRQTLIELLPVARRERYLSSKKRDDETLFAYALLRQGIKEYAGVENMPDITYGEKGRPEFENSSLCFSLSHTRGCSACAISDKPIGCDVEKLRVIRQNLARKVLPEHLYSEYESSDNPERVFFEYWTKLESVLKKQGTGFSGGLVFDASENCMCYEQNGFIISACCETLPAKPVLVTRIT